MTQEELREKKRAVIERLYGGERKSYMHDYDIDTGECKYCHVFIGYNPSIICRIVTPDEVMLWSKEEQGL